MALQLVAIMRMSTLWSNNKCKILSFTKEKWFMKVIKDFSPMIWVYAWYGGLNTCVRDIGSIVVAPCTKRGENIKRERGIVF